MDAPLSARVRAILATPHDDGAMRAALATLEQMHAAPDLAAVRTQLPHDAQRHANAATHEFCAALAAVDQVRRARLLTQSLADMTAHTAATLREARAAHALADAAHAETLSLLEHADALDAQATLARTHAALAERLLQRLTLSPTEAAALEQVDGAPFFAALDRLYAILDDALVLMDACGADAAAPGTIPEDARATHDVRQRASAQLDAACQRLAHWCSAALRRLPLEGADVAPALKDALARLARHDELFRYAAPPSADAQRRHVRLCRGARVRP